MGEEYLYCLIYTILFYIMAIVIWKDKSWRKEYFKHDPTIIIMMIMCFILGTIGLCGVIIEIVEKCKISSSCNLETFKTEIKTFWEGLR